MTPNDPAFYMLQDDQLRSVATAAPRRSPSVGKADIGGRMRVARILKNAGVDSAEPPVRVAGSTNEVWRAGAYVIRVGFQCGAERLRREAILSQYLPAVAAYPQVIASGIEAFGEWIIVRHVEGVPLSQAWTAMSVEDRRNVTFELAGILKALHQTNLSDVEDAALEFHEGEGALALPHQLPPSRLLELLEQARYLHGMDRALIDDVTNRVKVIHESISEHERYGLVHGDLHFENVLVHNGRISAMLDFEWSRPGPGEIDLDILARFCSDPAMHIGGNYQVNAGEFKDVFKWINQIYPDLFASPVLRDRLLLCALSFDVPWLLRLPPNGPLSSLPKWHPLCQIRDVMLLGTYAERLGW